MLFPSYEISSTRETRATEFRAISYLYTKRVNRKQLPDSGALSTQI
jgi:hypothetical protein